MTESTATRGIAVAHATWPQVVFSIPEARRALTYLCRVVRDAAAAFHEVQQCRAKLAGRLEPSEAAAWSARRDRALKQLDSATDECNAVRADLLDFSQGLVRFQAQINGRPVSLLWRLGEPVAGAWQELAFSSESRQPSMV